MSQNRLDALERRVRFLQIYAGVASALLLVSALPGRRAAFDVVSAERFVVLDENGGTRAVLGMQSEKDSDTIRTEDSSARVEREVRYVALRLVGDEQRTAELVVRDDDEPYLLLSEPDDRQEATLTARGLGIADDGDTETRSMDLGPDGVTFALDENDEDEGSAQELRTSLSTEEGLVIESERTAAGVEQGYQLELSASDSKPRLLIQDKVKKATLFHAP